ncbi:hypothetical protein ACH3VR_22935 [Microbacterium sp. B2969]|uniref:DUF3040 domain-containing protein n=1 Tax=Microbacterium alkaliflavum TaxID=3248839 RepID=A0ABW7QEA4_9MICO
MDAEVEIRRLRRRAENYSLVTSLATTLGIVTGIAACVTGVAVFGAILIVLGVLMVVVSTVGKRACIAATRPYLEDQRLGALQHEQALRDALGNQHPARIT